jgi:hypothetical protein
MSDIVVRDIHEETMVAYNPDGTILTITNNVLCLNDILIQIRMRELEGYTVSIGNRPPYEITKRGSVKGYGTGIINCLQLRILMTKDDEAFKEYNREVCKSLNIKEADFSNAL